jgi:hypothetical protein
MFGADQLMAQKIHVHVQVFVVQFIDHLLLDDGAEDFQIDGITGVRIWRTGHRYEQFIIVTVPIHIGTLAENGQVALFVPCGIPHLMGGTEPLPTGDVYFF